MSSPIDQKILARLEQMKPSVLAAVLRAARRIEQGFKGEITLAVKNGGVHFIRWTETETGDDIREELG